MDEIINLFLSLSRPEREKVMRKLKSLMMDYNPVIDLVEFSQKRYGQNAIKTSKTTGAPFNPQTTVEWKTPWGTFSAAARNGNEAAKLAAEKALDGIPGD